jgi:hypothetical protein
MEMEPGESGRRGAETNKDGSLFQQQQVAAVIETILSEAQKLENVANALLVARSDAVTRRVALSSRPGWHDIRHVDGRGAGICTRTFIFSPCT